ncbi:MAG: hypothetical protein Q4D26_02405 [Clostridia bacterium]|nr:hypothetical protein [Clostridia bacterium]
MFKYDIVENSIIDVLNKSFLMEFESIYKSIRIKGKGCLIEYISAFFRKWYYSALIEDTIITPNCIAEYGAGAEYVYPVIKSKTINRIGSLNISNIKYSLDNHPICFDFRGLVENFKNGIALDADFKMDFCDIKKIDNITNYDSNYITYLFMLGMDLGYIEKMPSVGVSMYCTTGTADELDSISNKDLLIKLTEAAIKISASFLSDDFMGENYIVTESVIREWLKNPEPIDKIFEEAYGEIALEISDSILIEDMDEMERLITAKTYARGIILDKWFLTPFSYYFRFIDTTYMYEFSFYDEMMFLINAVETNKVFKEETIIDSAVYSPCTMYKLSKLGSDYFEIEYEDKIPYIFKNMKAEDILDAAIGNYEDGRFKILNAYEPEFDVYNLRITDAENDLWFNLEVKENMTLDNLHVYITNIFQTPVIICQSYRFYKLPASPFTEYTPRFMEMRGPHTEDNTVKGLLDIGEECYYEVVLLSKSDKLESRTINIKLKDIIRNKSGVPYPRIGEVSPEIKMKFK